jgi:hypothetical protein
MSSTLRNIHHGAISALAKHTRYSARLMTSCSSPGDYGSGLQVSVRGIQEQLRVWGNVLTARPTQALELRLELRQKDEFSINYVKTISNQSITLTKTAEDSAKITENVKTDMILTLQGRVGIEADKGGNKNASLKDEEGEEKSGPQESRKQERQRGEGGQRPGRRQQERPDQGA